MTGPASKNEAADHARFVLIDQTGLFLTPHVCRTRARWGKPL